MNNKYLQTAATAAGSAMEQKPYQGTYERVDRKTVRTIDNDPRFVPHLDIEQVTSTQLKVTMKERLGTTTLLFIQSE